MDKGKSIMKLLELLSTCGSSASKANAKILSTLKPLKGQESWFLVLLLGDQRHMPACKDLAFVEAMVPQLVGYLQDKSWSTRYRTIDALALLREGVFKDQLPTILGKLNDEDECPRPLSTHSRNSASKS